MLKFVPSLDKDFAPIIIELRKFKEYVNLKEEKGHIKIEVSEDQHAL